MMKPTGTDNLDLIAPAQGASGVSLRAGALAWLRLINSGEATVEDLAALERWRSISPAHAVEFAEASLLWSVLHDAARHAERECHAVTEQTKVARPNFRPSRRSLLIGGTALAASAASIMVVRPPFRLWPSAMEMAADYRTGTGERRKIAFQDQVAVELNTRTSLDIRARTDDSVQFELISGEAAIANEVGRDTNVTVIAGEGRVRARNASFNIRKTGSDVRVSCVGGRVDVVCSERSFALAAGEQLDYDAEGGRDVVSADTETVTAWQRGLLMFRRAPLAEVIDEVNRYRGGRIVLVDSALGRRQVLANFRLDRIDDVIGFIAKAMNLRVRSLPGGIVLVG